jgi:hypothetical protein
MPSNVFLYQLEEKTAPIDKSDRFLIEDVGASTTKTTSLSSIGISIFSEGVNFRIKNGNVLQIKETQGADAGKFKTLVVYSGTIALSGGYET